MNETIVFTDAGFLSKLSKHFGNGKYLVYNLIDFSKRLSKKQDLFCKKTFYYTSPPFIPNKPSEVEIKKKKDYDNFISRISENKDFIVREGRCQRLRINNQFEYSQKGVDALVVMDMMDAPVYYPNIKKIILIASDSDFVPIIKNLGKKGIKTILYTYYEKNRKSIFSTSNELIKSVYKYVLLKRDDFTSCPLIKIKIKKDLE